MSATNNNPVSELTELLFRGLGVENKRPKSSALKYELRFGEIELKDGDVNFTVTAKRAYLALTLEGLEILPDTKYGDALHNNDGKETVQVLSTTQRQSHLSTGASAGLTKGKAKVSALAGGGIKQRSQDTTTRRTTRTVVTRVVKPIGGDKWEICKPDGSPLEGLYLNGSVDLCLVSAKAGANRVSAQARVIVRQRDLLVSNGELTFMRRLTTNKEKLLHIFIKKALHQQVTAGTSEFNGLIALSQSIFEQ